MVNCSAAAASVMSERGRNPSKLTTRLHIFLE
jgi:hypothetical protein